MKARVTHNQERSESIKDKAFSFTSGISRVFSAASKHENEQRNRERIRQDLVREYFETEPLDSTATKANLSGQLAKLLRLN